MRVKGTIIDLETIGSMDFSYKAWETEKYLGLKPTIFGYISGDLLVQYCAEGEDEIPVLIKIMDELLPGLDDPYYALNCHFERGVCEASKCYVPEPLLDVRGHVYRGSKWSIRERLGIPTYGDPFLGDGKRCISEWKKGGYEDCLTHNRACLQIERDILDYACGLK